jgi:mRNA-degrading endonuclease RelE of RelBE toxin-antitoxin system
VPPEPYEVRLSTSAQRTYESLDQPLRKRIKDALLDLAAKVEGGSAVASVTGSAGPSRAPRTPSTACA